MNVIQQYVLQSLCQNQCFQKRLYPELTVQATENKGCGLATKANIKAGDFIIEYVGELINKKEFNNRVQQKLRTKDERFYYFSVSSDLIIDAGTKGNLARFMNHSCEPNCVSQLWQVLGNQRVGFFAVMDIPAVS